MGNTPTCVGKTHQGVFVELPCKKHPHVRGEDCFPVVVNRQAPETPPRAWGRRHPITVSANCGGNTPTCVGKTLAGFKKEDVLEKHPHVRGEDATKTGVFSKEQETPPRAWGRLNDLGNMSMLYGNTPTCVGKTYRPREILAVQRKHPHVRGEDLVAPNACTLQSETPPRAWGRPAELVDGCINLGNTPTCVGKTPNGAPLRTSP